ncbi:SpoIIE family protein phosphatase, partial [Streptomyces sp. NPDC017964]|uniref:SpoIIE family protein phosphatase n=1 Tax=Streptomyces sp. NPDC017964 TaxID=3365022 RepID=UPI0037A31DB6
QPFESAELTVPEGSRLVLYTDGLVEDRDRDLIRAVSAGSSTSSHLCRTKTTNEGCRGLFLVAQFAQHWDTCIHPGKRSPGPSKSSMTALTGPVRISARSSSARGTTRRW